MDVDKIQKVSFDCDWNSTFVYGVSFWPKVDNYFHDKRSRYFYEQSRFSWWMVEIFMMNDQGFHHDWSRFSSWLVQIFIMTGPDFHHERSRIAYCFGYNPKVQGEHLAVQLLWGATWLLVTCVSLIYLVDEFFFFALVKLNKMRRLSEPKVLSFCSWC